ALAPTELGHPAGLPGRGGAQARGGPPAPALDEAPPKICGLDADRSAPADTIEQLVGIADRRHPQGRKQSFVELTRGAKVAHAQYDMRHAVNLDFGIRHNQSPCYGARMRSGLRSFLRRRVGIPTRAASFSRMPPSRPRASPHNRAAPSARFWIRQRVVNEIMEEVAAGRGYAEQRYTCRRRFCP